MHDPPKDSPHIGQRRKSASACSKRCKLTILIPRYKMCRRRKRRKLGDNADPNAFERTTGGRPNVKDSKKGILVCRHLHGA